AHGVFSWLEGRCVLCRADARGRAPAARRVVAAPKVVNATAGKGLGRIGIGRTGPSRTALPVIGEAARGSPPGEHRAAAVVRHRGYWWRTGQCVDRIGDGPGRAPADRQITAPNSIEVTTAGAVL